MRSTSLLNDVKTRSYGSALLIFSLFLLFISFLEVFSSSSIKGESLYNDYIYFVKKHLVGIILSAIIFFITYFQRKLDFRKLSPYLIFGAIISLSFVLIPGLYIESGGAKRWLNVGLFRIQTSELAKISFAFYLSWHFSKPEFDINVLKAKIAPIVVFIVLSIFLLLQPDFGTTFILLFTLATIFFVSGASRQFLTIFGFLASSAIAYLVISEPYRIKRIMAFSDPWENFRSSGFQIVQSMLAFRNGAIFGSGFGSSKQKLYFLPEAHTDFIAAVIAEELGSFGTIVVIMSLYGISYCLYKIATKQKNMFHKYLCFCASILFLIHIVLNISMCIGMAPPKGLTLPLLSYGISSQMIFTFLVSYGYTRSRIVT